LERLVDNDFYNEFDDDFDDEDLLWYSSILVSVNTVQ
jgi:hypothetical protein